MFTLFYLLGLFVVSLMYNLNSFVLSLHADKGSLNVLGPKCDHKNIILDFELHC